MKQFMDKDFLLSTDMAKTLYHDFAENMPILDYHCHINPQEIYEDRKTAGLTISPRYGWAATITSGARCVPTAWTRSM